MEVNRNYKEGLKGAVTFRQNIELLNEIRFYV